MEPGFLNICLRLACAMLVGLVIGTEREYTNRPAGMRTHVLVSLGACVVAITGVVLHSNYAADPGRLAAQVITGVGFLGAGTILREGFHVKGLTTAASLWTVACLGIAAGYGYYAVALAGTLFAFITLTILEFLQDRLPGRHPVSNQYELTTSNISAGLDLIHAAAKAQHAEILGISATETDGVGYRIIFRANFTGLQCKQRSARFFSALIADSHTISASEIDPAASKV
jgi:putative Mg2+ transporter-C (MgtC) family protein